MRRRLESVEHQTEQLGRAVADSREVDGLREDAFKDRLTAIDKSVREVSRNIQLVRDKQVPEVAHCSHSQSLQIIHQNRLPHDLPLMQELAGAQAELAAHLSTKVVKSHYPDHGKEAVLPRLTVCTTQSQCINPAMHSANQCMALLRKACIVGLLSPVNPAPAADCSRHTC